MKLTLDEALQKAIEAHKAGQIQEADRLYTAILQAQPKHPDANHNMGVLAAGVGKVQQALPFFKTALEANPRIEQFWLSYIDALIKEQQFEKAKQVIEKAKKREEGSQYNDDGIVEGVFSFSYTDILQDWSQLFYLVPYWKLYCILYLKLTLELAMHREGKQIYLKAMDIQNGLQLFFNSLTRIQNISTPPYIVH